MGNGAVLTADATDWIKAQRHGSPVAVKRNEGP
jgi:hypothetical protein